jgi:hypothetical protein
MGNRMHVLRAAVAVVIGAGLAACSSAGQGQGGAGTSSGTVAAAEQSVQFTVDGTTTYGTLDVPAHRAGQRLAAALLMAGSGPTDRDGDDAAALWLAQIELSSIASWIGATRPGRKIRPRPSGPGAAFRGSRTPNRSPSSGVSTVTSTPHRDFSAAGMKPV